MTKSFTQQSNIPDDDWAGRFVIVLQMGKVASTSIVRTLDTFDGIAAVQCHFLGQRALGGMLPTMVGSNLTNYFFEHMLGQFTQNVGYTRQANRIRAGRLPSQRLQVISLTREPTDWVRSATVQDMVGYLPLLTQIANAHDIVVDNDGQFVEPCLTLLLDTFNEVIEAAGGIDAYKKATAHFDEVTARRGIPNTPLCRGMFDMFRRPHEFFWDGFEPALELRISEMTKVEDWWELSEEHADVVIVRYEDMTTALPKYLARSNVCEIDTFLSENISSQKPYASQVTAAFSSDAGQRFKQLCRETEYSRVFRYA